MRRLVLACIFLIVSSSAYSAEKVLAVPTDAKATYAILEIGGKFPNRTIVTKRIGSSGTSYSKRIYNCSRKTVKYLGTGDNLAEMTSSTPDPNMSEIVPESTADYVGRQACKR